MWHIWVSLIKKSYSVVDDAFFATSLPRPCELSGEWETLWMWKSCSQNKQTEERTEWEHKGQTWAKPETTLKLPKVTASLRLCNDGWQFRLQCIWPTTRRESETQANKQVFKRISDSPTQKKTSARTHTFIERPQACTINKTYCNWVFFFNF